MGVSLSRGGRRRSNGTGKRKEPPLPAAIFGQMSEPQALRWFGRMAGVMFIGGALLPIPSTLLLEPRPDPLAYSLTAVVFLTGLACLALPWDRASIAWLHSIAAIATLQVALTVALFDQLFAVLYFVIAVFISYGFGRPRAVFPQMALISLAILAPIAYDPDGAREALQIALLLLPSIWMLAGGVVFLRTQVDTRERTYRQFAEQALRLSERIAGAPAVTPPPARSLAKREPPPPPPRRRGLRAGLAGLGALIAVPLGFAGLAAAGVSLPGVVVDPFERLGIDLPNQDEDSGDAAGAVTPGAPARVAREPAAGFRPAARERSGKAARRGGDPKRNRRDARDRRRETGSSGGPAGTTVASEPAPATPPVTGGLPDSGSAGGSSDPGISADAPSGTDAGPVRSLLQEALDGVGGLLEAPLQSEPEAEAGRQDAP